MEAVPVVRQVQRGAVNSRVSPIPHTDAKENDRDRSFDRNSMMISCPKCKRIFSKPLNMLDFSSGKAQLINVCPYCNYVLGDVRPGDAEVRVFEPDDKETEEIHGRR